MAENGNEHDKAERMLALLSEGAEGELRLLKNERKAERRLADALATLAGDEKQLEKAVKRLARSREAVAAAEAELRESQARRSAGPEWGQD